MFSGLERLEDDEEEDEVEDVVEEDSVQDGRWTDGSSVARETWNLPNLIPHAGGGASSSREKGIACPTEGTLP